MIAQITIRIIIRHYSNLTFVKVMLKSLIYHNAIVIYHNGILLRNNITNNIMNDECL